MSSNKINKNTIPEGFTVSMTLVDMIPVIFFGASGVFIGLILGSLFVEICAAFVFISGFIKVIWKLVAAVKKKNIWPLFIQMRIAMPISFIAMIVGIIIALTGFQAAAVWGALLGFPQLIFFIIGILGMAGMVVCAVKLDSSDPKSNWIEQIINSFAQLFIFLGILMIFLGK